MTDYALVEAQLRSLVGGERMMLPNLANASALLNEALEDINWVGFYLMANHELVLGPFQGRPACIRIPLNKGVCGAAATTAVTQRVADVHSFAGHISCDGRSNSEIVVPLSVDGKVVGVLDIDSPAFDRFDERDQAGLEAVARVLEDACDWQGFA